MTKLETHYEVFNSFAPGRHYQHVAFCTKTQGQEIVIFGVPDRQQQPNVETLISSKRIPTTRINRRWRTLRRRRKSLRWCAARMKATKIDRVDWKKIIVGTVFVIGIVLIVYCCHPYMIYVDIIKRPKRNFLERLFPRKIFRKLKKILKNK